LFLFANEKVIIPQHLLFTFALLFFFYSGVLLWHSVTVGYPLWHLTLAFDSCIRLPWVTHSGIFTLAFGYRGLPTLAFGYRRLPWVTHSCIFLWHSVTDSGI